jgi:hypothetical protein
LRYIKTAKCEKRGKKAQNVTCKYASLKDKKSRVWHTPKNTNVKMAGKCMKYKDKIGLGGTSFVV